MSQFNGPRSCSERFVPTVRETDSCSKRQSLCRLRRKRQRRPPDGPPGLPKADQEASVDEKTSVADVGKEDVEVLSPRARVASVRNAKVDDGKEKPEEGKLVGASSPAGNRGRGRAANGKEKRNAEIELPESKKTKKVKEDVFEDKGSVPDGSKLVTRSIIIEACTQCKSFKERADKVKRGLESAIPGIAVEINPQKPRRGYFEIREEKTEVILSLPSMNRPFTLMKQLNMDKVIEDLIKRCK
ncbi:uncharacterized protein LOC110037526 [Phalaenopsis equestris]|uniref:uncharacterized protein LOC110037526 n=1 Tax=Phalaenopsis equestris TaxID=78828 RepID=UPI0009E6464D|nr:uncharacterized protein LOC110037526 [Phalaenopsis equestris]